MRKAHKIEEFHYEFPIVQYSTLDLSKSAASDWLIPALMTSLTHGSLF